MGLGYQCEVNRRYGGHGGHDTEWEFSARSATARVQNIQALDHPMVVAFHWYGETGGTDGFCVLAAGEGWKHEPWPGDTHALVDLLFRYLTAWPNEEGDLIRQIAATRQ